MKRSLYFVYTLFVIILLAACVPPTVPAGAPAAQTQADSSAFPVTLDHKYGSTTITAKPERIVTVGLTDHDALLALGIVPVGTTEWFGGYPGSIWPWAQDELEALGGALPEAVGGEAINFEKIAALQPDLILALYSGLKPEEYDLLTQIAPTVAQPAAYVDYGIPWQELTVTVGKAVGQADAAQALVDEVEARFAQVQADHPEFVGATAVATMAWQGIYLYGPQDIRSRLLTALGFVLPEGIAEITGSTFGGNLSMERADLLDTDVIIWIDPQEAEGELGGPVYQVLPVHTEGREVLLSSDDELAIGGATSFVSVLSLPYLLDNLVPMLVAALDGDPATATAAPATAAPDTTAATRTVTDDLGRSVEVPAQPQRIVALQDLQVLRPLLDLGLGPIASTTHPAYAGAFRFVDEYDVSAIAAVGLLGEPNLEQLVLLKPDLIIGTLSAGTDGQLEQLSAIAPTLVYNAGRPVIEYHRSLAEAVGAVAAYEGLMADYETRLADLREKVAPISSDLLVSLLAFNPNAGQIEIGEGPYTLVLRGAGINQPDPQVNFESADEGVRRYWISPELLPAHDADLIFLLYTRDPAVNAPITDSAIWATLNAVQAGQVVEINGATWYVQSVRSLFSVIDALEQHLVEAAVDTSVFE